VWRLPLACIVLAASSVSAAAAGSAPYTAGATGACLTSHSVLVSPVATSRVLPPHYAAVAALQVSFAMIPAQAIDSATIVFEKDPATARRVRAAWLAYSVKRAQHVQGIDQAVAKRAIEQLLRVSGNAIVGWGNAVKPATRKLVASCLR
jgi:hypothetical protein